MTVHFCLGCGQVWWGGWSPTTEHEDCDACRDESQNALSAPEESEGA